MSRFRTIEWCRLFELEDHGFDSDRRAGARNEGGQDFDLEKAM